VHNAVFFNTFLSKYFIFLGSSIMDTAEAPRGALLLWVYNVSRHVRVNTGFLLASFKASPMPGEYVEDNRQCWSLPLNRMGTRTAALPISTCPPYPSLIKYSAPIPRFPLLLPLLSLLSLTALLLLNFLFLGSIRNFTSLKINKIRGLRC